MDTCCRTIDLGGGAKVVCDTSGNVAEWVVGAGDLYFAAGGSFLNTEATDLMCGSQVSSDLVAPGPSVGFRCCTPQRTN